MKWSVLGDVADIQLLTRRNILPEGRKREKVSFLGKMGEWGWGWGNLWQGGYSGVTSYSGV